MCEKKICVNCARWLDAFPGADDYRCDIKYNRENAKPEDFCTTGDHECDEVFEPDYELRLKIQAKDIIKNKKFFKMNVVMNGAIYVKPLSFIAQEARVCHNKESLDAMIQLQQNQAYSGDEERDFATCKRALDDGHLMALEPIIFNFYAENVSRALLAQLTTHRLVNGRLTKSQRYVKGDRTFWDNHIIPTMEYIKDENLRRMAVEEFITSYRYNENVYDRLTNYGVRPEDARYITAQGAPTTTVFGMNMREFLTVFYPLRSSLHAQEEIRILAENMFSAVYIAYSHDFQFRKFLAYYKTEWLTRMRTVHKEWAV